MPDALTVIDCVFCPDGDHTLPVAMVEVKTTLPPWQKVVGPPAEMVGAGLGLTVTVVVGDVAEQLFPLVTVTVYDPPVLTVMDCVVCPPGDHRFPVALLEVSVTLPPWQKVVEPLAVINAVGSVFTVTVVTAEVPEQPFPSVTDTL